MEIINSDEDDNTSLRTKVKILEREISLAEAQRKKDMKAYERTTDVLRPYIQQKSSNTTPEDIMQLNAQLLANIDDDNDDGEEEEEEEEEQEQEKEADADD